jgi:hypothetical protein
MENNGKPKAGTPSARFEESRQEGFFHQSSSISPSCRELNDHSVGESSGIV